MAGGTRVATDPSCGVTIIPHAACIVIAWPVTLPVTITIAGGLDYLLESPSVMLLK